MSAVGKILYRVLRDELVSSAAESEMTDNDDRSPGDTKVAERSGVLPADGRRRR